MYKGLNNGGELYVEEEDKENCFRKFVRDKNIEMTAEDFKERWAKE